LFDAGIERTLLAVRCPQWYPFSSIMDAALYLFLPQQAVQVYYFEIQWLGYKFLDFLVQ
jgi:hypothetical protein